MGVKTFQGPKNQQREKKKSYFMLFFLFFFFRFSFPFIREQHRIRRFFPLSPFEKTEKVEEKNSLHVWPFVGGQLLRMFEEFHQPQLLNQLHRLFR